jgi:hypothetical protein
LGNQGSSIRAFDPAISRSSMAGAGARQYMGTMIWHPYKVDAPISEGAPNISKVLQAATAMARWKCLQKTGWLTPRLAAQCRERPARERVILWVNGTISSQARPPARSIHDARSVIDRLPGGAPAPPQAVPFGNESRTPVDLRPQRVNIIIDRGAAKRAPIFQSNLSAAQLSHAKSRTPTKLELPPSTPSRRGAPQRRPKA